MRLDTTPLKESRDFRLLFIAGTVFYLGGMVAYVAVPYQLYTETGSNFAVGALGIVELVPLIFFGLYGGALADHVDRRKMLIGTALAQVVLTGVLAVNAFSDDPQIWVIYVVGALAAAAGAMQRPSKEALEPRTVRHDQIPAASALSSFGTQVGVLVGPAVGGLLLAYVGVGWCFVVDGVGLLVATGLFLAMRSYPHAGETTPPSLQGIREGIRYAVRRRDLLGTYLVDIMAMLMAMPVVLFPALAEDIFSHPELLGLLYTAETVGAMLATATSGWTSRVHHHGRAVVIAALRLRRRDRADGPRPEPLGGGGVPRLRRRRGHGQRDVPLDDLEPDHPRLDARPAGRHRDAVLLDRAARRPDPGRPRRGCLVGPRVDHQRRRPVRRRGGRHRRVAAGLLALRHPHRRARRGRARLPAGRRGRRRPRRVAPGRPAAEGFREDGHTRSMRNTF